jgi:chromosomal replication initiation ATPase DnaA
MKVYISGKISGLPWDKVKEKFEKAKNYLESVGYEVLDPTVLNPPERSWAESMKVDIRELVSCDALVLLSDWFNSKGAKFEYEIALKVNMPVFRLISFKDVFYMKKFNQNLIFEIIEKQLNVTHEEIVSGKRQRDIIDAKQIAAKLLRDNFKLGWSDIGALIATGYSNAIAARKKANTLISCNTEFREKYNKLRTAI